MSEASERALEIMEKSRSVSSGSRRIDQHDLSGVAQVLNALREQAKIDAGSDALTRPGGGMQFQQIKPVYR